MKQKLLKLNVLLISFTVLILACKKDVKETISREKAAYIEFTTTKAVEKTIELSIDANEEDKAGIWIDLNNNGTKDNGEKVTSFRNNVAYTLGSQTVRVYGKVTAFGTSYKWIKEQQKYIGQQLTSLDISQNKELESLYCPGNQLTSLDISQNKELEYLDCSGNQLTSLEVSQNKELEYLHCGGNQLTSLEVSQNKELEYLHCGGNQLTSLDISQNKELKSLYCDSNQLTSLDISQNTQLKNLFCPGNQLTSLDISQNKELEYLYCDSNQLTSLDISQNTKMKLLRCYRNSNLTCIKVNQEQLNNIPSNWQKDDTATYSTNCN